ncbi:protein phosphatase 2C domain-containing protein [Solwaraspora sp. WMMD1047]|uniref:PP2C family protein-serine/threonine phosphatase n=1 Tax=Solwaraspora sp. WMMD1047 TaxID=3016102 RepID=UPI002416CAB7|nr:protein phosphatase 2C domain-containing protein [Solwaraspora sp. WMMD1047]MDG4831476.1 protein phosphatase 2C domain-containing protein [Solwaraspora sp. WMMD1047]
MEISLAEWTVAGRRLTAAAGSVVGRRYRANYDVFHLDAARPLAVVADGMGDGPGSTAAGRTAMDVFVRHAASAQDAGALRGAVAEVQRAVIAAGRELSDLTGCTLTAFVGDSSAGAAWLVQLGDSRAYRLRDGLLELLTVDHTAAWLGVLNGWYAPDSPPGRAARYRLTRYAGHPGAPEPDLLNVSLRPGDRFLLCTDGVADQVGYDRISQVVAGEANPGAAVRTLLTDTLVTGDDNATAVLLNVG